MTGGADNVDFAANLKHRVQFPPPNKAGNYYVLIFNCLRLSEPPALKISPAKPPVDPSQRAGLPGKRIVKVVKAVRGTKPYLGTTKSWSFISVHPMAP
jgi:hypothetical protein